MNDFENATLLAIDTSSSHLRLAVRFGADRLVQSSEQVDRSHGQMIMRKLSNLLSSGGMDPKNLGGLIVCTGPGSFTGLRVGISVAKGMAVGLDIPIVGVSLFDIAAYRISDSPSPVLALVPQRKGEFYCVQIESGCVDYANVSTLTAVDIQAKSDQHRIVIIGSTESGLVQTDGQPIEVLEYDASDLLQLGVARLEDGNFDNIELLEPLYFGKSQAEINFEQRAKKG